MKLDKRHLVVSIVLMIGSVIYSVWAFQQTPARKPVVASGPVAAADTTAPAPAVAGTPAAPVDPTQIPPLPDVALDRLPQWSRNPFAPIASAEPAAVAAVQPVSPTESEPEVVVSTILMSSTRRAALVNGATVHIGDMVGSSRVVDIQRDAVVLQAPSGTQRTIERRRFSSDAGRAGRR